MKKRPVLLIAGLFGLLTATVNVLFNPAACDDAIRYYIPMAEAFGRGDFVHAFHHSIPPLVPLLAGLLAAAGLSAWTALKTVAAACWLLSAFPLYRIARRMLKSETQAQWCALGCLLLTEIMRRTFEGTLEPVKILLLFCVIDGLAGLMERWRLRDLFYTGISMALLGLVRNECVAFLLPAELFLLTGLRLPVVRRLGAAAAVLAICFAVWAPVAVQLRSEFGVPALTSKQVESARRILGAAGISQPEQPVRLSVAPVYIKADSTESGTCPDIPSSKCLSVRIENTLLGSLPFLMPFWICGMAIRIRRREWSRGDMMCLVFFVYNALLFWVFVDYTAVRYIAAAAPLLLPWALTGLAAAGRVLSAHVPAVRRISRRWLYALLAVLIAGCGVKGLGRVRHFLEGDYDDWMQVSLWLRDNAAGLDANQTPDADRGFGRDSYSGGKALSVAACTPDYVQIAGADFVSMDWNRPPPPEKMLAYLAGLGADVLIEDRDVRERHPEALRHIRRLPVLKEFPEQHITVYSLDIRRLEAEAPDAP